MNVLLGASFALVEARYLEHEGDFHYVDDFNDLCSRLLGDEDIETAIVLEEDQGFVPSRKYPMNEIAKSHIPLTTLRALIKSKVLLFPATLKVSSIFPSSEFNALMVCSTTSLSL